jgi:hypothetical protein
MCLLCAGVSAHPADLDRMVAQLWAAPNDWECRTWN